MLTPFSDFRDVETLEPREHMEFESFLRTELPPAVESSVREFIQHRVQPAQEEVLLNLNSIICTSIENVIRQWRRTNIGATNPAGPGSSRDELDPTLLRQANNAMSLLTTSPGPLEASFLQAPWDGFLAFQDSSLFGFGTTADLLVPLQFTDSGCVAESLPGQSLGDGEDWVSAALDIDIRESRGESEEDPQSHGLAQPDE